MKQSSKSLHGILPLSKVLVEARNMGGDETIYVVENDPVVSADLQAFLSRKGLSVHMLSTGEELLALASLADIGCVITDLQLPKMQGLEIHKELRWRTSNLSLIGISHQTDPSVSSQMMSHGAVAILDSPPDLDRLWVSVNDGLEKSRSREAARRKSSSLRARLNLLTESERQVMKCLVQGHSHKLISSLLDLSLRSIDRRRKNILEKTEVPSIQGLVASLAELQFPD